MNWLKESAYLISAIAVTAVCWGSYGPILHKGSSAMQGDRWRAFLCVGLAYFVIAVVVPVFVLSTSQRPGHWTTPGVLWSFAGGSAGALGALGVILAFNLGGKPYYVMPLVFGCAPAVNAFIAIYLAGNWKDVSPMFLAGLVIVAVGAMMVLFFAPRAHGPSPSVGHEPTVETAAPMEHKEGS